MVTTRSQAKMTSEGALEHVLGNVLGYPEDHQVRLALAYFGVNDIHALTPLPYFKMMISPFLTSFQTQKTVLHLLKQDLSTCMQED